MQTHPYAGAHIPYPATAQQPHVKAEPVDGRYMLSGPPPNIPYTMPTLPGPQLAAPRPPHVGGQQSILSFPPGPPVSQPQSLQNGVQGTPIGRLYVPPGATPARIPQADGPSESDDESPSPPPTFAPRSSHPSLPQPRSQASTSTAPDEEAINSDLDDSDSEAEEEAEDGTAGETDIVFCTYDKV